MDAPDESPKSSDVETKKDLYDGQPSTTEVISVHSGSSDYRLYKRRFVGLVGLVVLNVVSGMTWPWFGPISNDMVAEFGITLDQVNWLGNVMACIYLPVSLAVPEVIRRYGIRRCCDIGAATLLISAWIRYAGTVHSLSSGGAYALLFVGQFFAAIAQPIFQVIGPKYSETWFDLKGRTTATMILAIANPVGGALGQLLSPIVGNTRQSILVLGIMSSVAAPFVFLISAAPPTPPTYSASKKAPGILSLLRVMANKGRSTDPSMTFRERIDFTIMFFVFGVLSSAVNVFGILTGEILQPVGYSSDTAGFMGATLILSGILAAVVTAPLFDRVFTSHLAITAKSLVPILAVAWLCFIWVVKPNNAGAVYALCAIVGIASITMLPVALELACEITRNADGSSALLWFACNSFAIIFILVEGALRAGPNANPPLNMRNALIFNGVVVMATSSSIFFLRGRQTRKQLDQEKRRQSISLQTRPPAEPAGEA
ncbi:major facilitator superfamily domain-containing protein [Mycena albidolilacea]|uniref:Major facilitator superfamily domain-containing protein n=1 Tax=Mycena albidolilacea TaxID=1033008 RepID=A0AAD6ZZR3_9AGAR|nr:major facilitator superfamily domain-containing protein [Mycena albidolilacea]